MMSSSGRNNEAANNIKKELVHRLVVESRTAAALQRTSIYFTSPSPTTATQQATVCTSSKERNQFVQQQYKHKLPPQLQPQYHQRRTGVTTTIGECGGGVVVGDDDDDDECDDSAGENIRGIDGNNLIIGNISCGSGSSNVSTAALVIPAFLANIVTITPPTTKRVKVKLLVQKKENNNIQDERKNIVSKHHYSASSLPANNRSQGGGATRANRKDYLDHTVGVISARENDFSGGAVRDHCCDEEVENCLPERYLLTTGGSSGRGQREDRIGKWYSPLPSVVSNRAVKLTTKVTTLEEIICRPQLNKHQQNLYKRTNNYLSSRNMDGNGSNNVENNEEFINADNENCGVAVVANIVDSRCNSASSVGYPKKTVQFKRITSGGGTEKSAELAPTASMTSLQLRSNEKDDHAADPCSSSSVATASCSKSRQHQHGSSSSMSKPPRITVSSLPEQEDLGRSQHRLQMSSGRHSNLFVSSAPNDTENISSASSSSDPISDDGEQEIIDTHNADLPPRPRGSGSANSINRRRRCCCRISSCYPYCCCGFTPLSFCCHCCRDAVSKHQGNYSQGPTIETEPGPGVQTTGSTVHQGVAGQPHSEGSTTGSFHHGVTPFLPLCLVNVFGFISKISWGVLESLFGFNRGTYADHGKDGEAERRIRANDQQFNANFLYANNYIKTSKYTVVTFLPLNLFEQFQRLANFYFLCLLVLQMIPVISSLTPYTTAVPLMLVLALTAVKDAYDDYQRHVSDSQVNNRKSLVLRNNRNNWVLKEERWYKVQVGDVIRMENDQFVAADVLLLSTSEPNGLCYIETAELDGETNLKCRQCLLETADMGQDPNKLGSFNGVIICEPPNNHLNKFEGYMEWNGKRYPLDNDKVLLRGCILRNTQWCYGVVLFAGRDTKLMQNSGKTKFKRTSIDRLLNFIILGIVFFLLSMCLFCTIACGVWEIMIGRYFQSFLPWDKLVPDKEPIEGAVIISLLVFFSYAIILNTVVPISLYVSVEVIRLLQSFLINWDLKMYHEASNTPAKARTTTLNEELGQIEYIFSDKTGTLTQNIMTFNKCSIAGKSYGEIIDPRTGEPIENIETTEELRAEDDKLMKAMHERKHSLLCGLERANSPEAELLQPLPSTASSAEVPHHSLIPVDFSGNPHYESKFRFYDQSLYDAVKSGNFDVHLFFRHLALCHTVISEDRTGKLEYQAQSPDENALVSAARNFEFVFKERSPDSITISVLGKEEIYDLLCILDFNNVRKRMSVVVQREGKIMLLCKGADSIIFERLKASTDDIRVKTQEHLNKFAGEGLRTLVLAVKELTQEYFEDWKSRHHEAACSLTNRDEKLDAIYEEIERDMTLLGATAIEDKLQDGVPSTIANLLLADIKVWVLTGDKQETAINIGYSCQLLTDDLNDIFIVDSSSFEDVKMQLLKYLDAVQKGSCASVDGQRPGDVNMVTFTDSEGYHPGDDAEGNGGYAVVMNGHSLVHALHPQLEQLFLELASQCRAVICCRVTPLQKALVVELVKNYKRAVTLAIGDGANDVSMIKTAHIGVGISGQEGLQAVLASDYSIAQFRYLERLLLVHGRWSYYRMSKFLRYFFYKNFAFTLTHFWYAFFCGFSAQTVFDPMFISVYNLFYTSLPVLSIGVFDQDCNDENSLRYPKLYAPGHLNLLFNKKEFLKSALHGFVTSCVLFIVPYGTYNHAISADGQGLSDHMLFGSVVSTILVVVVTAQVALDTSYWTVFNHITVWGSLLFYFILHYIYNFAIRGRYLGSLTKGLQEASFWFTLVLTVMILIIPVLAWRFYFHDVHPTLSDRVRLKQRVSSVKTRQAHDRAFRTPSARRSRRSLRSSYAFAHQEGFGPLITSGKIMRKGKSNNNHTAGSTVASLVSSVTSFGNSPPVPPSLSRSPRITMVTPQEGASSSSNTMSVRL